MPPPDWGTWKHFAKLSAEEATALTMNFCPHTIKEILAEVSWSGSPALFPLVAGVSGMDFEDATEFEKRLATFERSIETGPATVDLETLARRFGWSIPDELANLATPATPEAEPKPAEGLLSDSERTKLLKHIGALALKVAEGAKLYQRCGEPNVDQIAKGVLEVLEGLPEDNNNINGARRSSLRDSISEGLALFKK